MKTADLPCWHVSGPHSGDYYLLLDDRSDCILETRLAEQILEARGASNAGLEIWIDETDKQVWYVFRVDR